MKALVSFFFTSSRTLLGYFGLGRGNCLYYPSCSEVIRMGIIDEGVLKTLYKIIPKRILMCNTLYRKLVNNGNN